MKTIKSFDRQKLYWIFQFTGWGLFTIVYSLIAFYFLELIHWKIVASYASSSLTAIFLTHQYRWFIKKKKWIRLSFWRLAIHIIIGSLLIAILWAAIAIPINEQFFRIESDFNDQNRAVGMVLLLFYMFVMIFGWSMVYFTFQFFFNYKSSEVEKWRLEAAVKDAELQALKSQINPHFIFNSLNNIRALIIEDPVKAREMINHLSGLLRYSVQFSNKEKVTLENELAVVENYLRLESIQFEDRLQYKIEVGPETLDYKIPPMVIQMLVENAIKHGISTLPEGGEIKIISHLENDALVVEVINTGQLKTKNETLGIGLKNATDRLKLLFGKLSDLRVQNLTGNMVSARFTIPLNV